ncbi:GPS-CTERM domain-containing protein [Nocardia sp. NPDC004068]|uniref:GPS-CTERM domain-containing protein n=1 Tax=Nocardia sp. NPDC004068 TaxID=3364303 RepID=UPI00367C01CE
MRYGIGCLLAALLVVPGRADAAPDEPASLQVSAAQGLTDGQRISVRGNGFRPGLAAVAVGLCRENFSNGLRDCDLDGGATFVNIGDDGTLPVVELIAHPTFKQIDCTAQRCVIAAAPLPGTEPPAVIAANSAAVAVDFAGSHLPSATAAPVAVAAPPTDTRGPSTPLWSLTAALLIVLAAVTLADRRRRL